MRSIILNFYLWPQTFNCFLNAPACIYTQLFKEQYMYKVHAWTLTHSWGLCFQWCGGIGALVMCIECFLLCSSGWRLIPSGEHAFKLRAKTDSHTENEWMAESETWDRLSPWKAIKPQFEMRLFIPPSLVRISDGG